MERIVGYFWNKEVKKFDIDHLLNLNIGFKPLIKVDEFSLCKRGKIDDDPDPNEDIYFPWEANDNTANKNYFLDQNNNFGTGRFAIVERVFLREYVEEYLDKWYGPDFRIKDCSSLYDDVKKWIFNIFVMNYYEKMLQGIITDSNKDKSFRRFKLQCFNFGINVSVQSI